MIYLSESVMAKSNVKLNALLDIEKEVQAKWDIEKTFESEPDNKRFLNNNSTNLHIL